MDGACLKTSSTKWQRSDKWRYAHLSRTWEHG